MRWLKRLSENDGLNTNSENSLHRRQEIDLRLTPVGIEPSNEEFSPGTIGNIGNHGQRSIVVVGVRNTAPCAWPWARWLPLTSVNVSAVVMPLTVLDVVKCLGVAA